MSGNVFKDACSIFGVEYQGLLTLISHLRCCENAMDARRGALARAIPCQATQRRRRAFLQQPFGTGRFGRIHLSRAACSGRHCGASRFAGCIPNRPRRRREIGANRPYSNLFPAIPHPVREHFFRNLILSCPVHSFFSLKTSARSCTDGLLPVRLTWRTRQPMPMSCGALDLYCTRWRTA